MKWKSIDIPNKYCKIQKSSYGESYDRMAVTMPSSEFKGYYFTHPINLCVNLNTYTKLSFNESFTFELIKIDREAGKRYSRPKLGADKITEIFTALEDQKYGNNTWICTVTNYERNGVFYHVDVEIGELTEKWFYPRDSDRKRQVGAFGLTPLMKMDETDCQNFKKYRALYSKKREVLAECIERIKKIDNIFSGEVSDKVIEGKQNLKNILSEEIASILSKYEKDVEPFKYLREVINNREIINKTMEKKREAKLELLSKSKRPRGSYSGLEF